MAILTRFKDNYERAKADLKGEARSHARRIKTAAEIPEVGDHLSRKLQGAPQPTKVAVRMLDGKPMMFYTDGSLRHALGKRITKAARKALKRAKRARQK